ncbi:MAG: hypothetical protein M3O50_14205, partial [Myxococcota bacterium]|nr:hypothetical protein [Myxococcota bacterium]
PLAALPLAALPDEAGPVGPPEDETKQAAANKAEAVANVATKDGEDRMQMVVRMWPLDLPEAHEWDPWARVRRARCRVSAAPGAAPLRQERVLKRFDEPPRCPGCYYVSLSPISR